MTVDNGWLAGIASTYKSLSQKYFWNEAITESDSIVLCFSAPGYNSAVSASWQRPNCTCLEKVEVDQQRSFLLHKMFYPYNGNYWMS